MSNIIYLSPANHTKPYVTGHNEKQQMELVAKKVQSILSEYDCTVCYPTVFNNPGINGNYAGRPDEAKKLKADVYVAIHSNAAGSANSTATGCCAFYHRNSAVGKKLATAFQQKLDAVCPIKSNRAESMKVIDGMTWFSGQGLGEIREPYNKGITSVLIETNFHDYKPTAEWIVANTAVIAKAIADVLIEFYGLKKKTAPSTNAITKDNLSKLVSCKVVNTPEYWENVNLAYLDELCTKALPSLDSRVSNGIKDFAVALKTLAEAGIINTPAYWTEQVKKVKYLDELIINMANRSRCILEKIVYAEAGGEDEKGQVLVANVIMNRVKHKSFPNSIYDVVMQTNQFLPVASGTYVKAVPTDKVKASVQKALSGVDYSQGALYFRAIKGATADCWHEAALKRLFDHGGHRFYA